MNLLVKTLVNEDGDPVPVGEQKWCWHTDHNGDNSVLCTGEFTSEGSHGGLAKFEFKQTRRGGITCEQCLAKIKELKAVRL